MRDPINELPNYLKDILKKSWAHDFQKHVFPSINEDRFSVLYSDNYASRPNTPVNVIVSLLIIKEMVSATDEELIGSLHFDIRYQYALRTTDYEKQPVSINTLYNFRTRLSDYYNKTGIDLIKEEVESQAKIIADKLSIDGKTVRMDSFMVSSSCKRLSRIELVYTVNHRFVKMLSEKAQELIPEECKAYLEKGNKNETIYKTRDTDTESKLLFLLNQTKTLHEIGLNGGDQIICTEEFQHIDRLIKEQTKPDETGELQPKKGKEISPESLQNPTDPDATFRTKYGPNTGYVANIVETFDDKNSVISTYDLQPNIHSDSAFADDVIEKLAVDEQEQASSEKIKVLVDGAYYSQDKAEIAASKGIDLIPSNLVGRKPSSDKLSYSCFTIDADKNIVSKCLNDVTPEESTYVNNTYTVKFNPQHCENCPHVSSCPFKVKKKHNVVTFSTKRYNTDLQREKMGDKDYIELTNLRAGVEGIPSVFRRFYEIDNLPVRGLVCSKIWLGFKVACYNVKKLLKGLNIAPFFLILGCILADSKQVLYFLKYLSRKRIIMDNIDFENRVLFVL